LNLGNAAQRVLVAWDLGDEAGVRGVVAVRVGRDIRRARFGSGGDEAGMRAGGGSDAKGYNEEVLVAESRDEGAFIVVVC